MKEIDLDIWFFNLPACVQSELTGITIDEDTATETDYVRFDLAVTDWWDSHDFQEKLQIRYDCAPCF
jgi:hypothetical protein